MTLDAISLCHANGDLFLAVRLGRAEFDRTKDFMAGWRLAQAHVSLGDAEEHDRVIEELRSIATTTGEQLAVAFQDSQSQYWLRGDHRAAMGVIDAALEAHPEADPGGGPITRQDLLARRALMFATSGRPAPAWEAYHAIGEPTSGTAGLLCLLTESIASTLDGNPQRAVDSLERARAVFASTGEAGTAMWVRRFVSNRVLAHGVAGDLDQWDADSELLLANAIDEQQLALGYTLRAHSFALRGQPSRGVPLIEAAQRWWQINHGGGGLPRRYVLATAVHLHGTAGDVARCRAVLGDYDADTHDSALLDAFAEVGRARMLVADQRIEEARRSLRAAVDTFADRARPVREMSCAYELVRLDRASDVAARMSEIAATSSSALFTVQAQHAAGAARNDRDALEQAADTFAARGYIVFAVGAMSHAADAARHDGDQRAVALALTRVQQLRAQCDDAIGTTLALPGLPAPIALTRREREIAVLAAQGMGNREISERLFISKRTAENHLARIYDKLGITSRVELVRLLDVPGAG